MKRYFIFFLLLLALSTVQSATELNYEETDFINVRPSAYDEDQDKLTYYFTYPLTNKGTWQTNYGDAGTYDTQVTVSDGRLTTVEDITIIIHKKEEPPQITTFRPDKTDLYIKEGRSIFFNIEATDLNKDILDTTWFIDDKLVSENTYFTYQSDYYSQGIHTVQVIVSDSVFNVTNNWSIEVEDVNRTKLLDDIISVVINESQTLELVLPDFSAFDLDYEISEPVGNDGIWETTFDDEGLYTVTIDITDNKQFFAQKNIKILVEEVDRHATPLERTNYRVREGQTLEIPLDYSDPDEDSVTVDVTDLPDGMTFEDNTLIFTPSFDTVQRENALDTISRNYHLLSEEYVVNVRASSGDFTVVQPLSIRVFNTNRKPTLSDIPDVTVREGEQIFFDLSATDPDNDPLTYSFDNTITRNGYQTTFGDAGTYLVDVTVSDGFLTDTKQARVRVLPVNRAPQLREILSLSANENEQISITLEATDPNNDDVTYSVSPLPEGAYFNGNTFFWTPSYLTTGDSKETLNLSFSVSDGELTDTKSTFVTVRNVNREPSLVTSSQSDGKEFYVDEPLSFSVGVFDPDNDDISYTWKTGTFSTFEGNDTLSVQYESPGKKRLSVTATDGEFTLFREWEFRVVKRDTVTLVRIQ